MCLSFHVYTQDLHEDHIKSLTTSLNHKHETATQALVHEQVGGSVVCFSRPNRDNKVNRYVSDRRQHSHTPVYCTQREAAAHFEAVQRSEKQLFMARLEESEKQRVLLEEKALDLENQLHATLNTMAEVIIQIGGPVRHAIINAVPQSRKSNAFQN